MADEVSCDLLQSATTAENGTTKVDIPKVYKYATWGTMSLCLGYLLRRASENRDAMSRTVDTRRVMAQEIRRRLRVTFGFA